MSLIKNSKIIIKKHHNLPSLSKRNVIPGTISYLDTIKNYIHTVPISEFKNYISQNIKYEWEIKYFNKLFKSLSAKQQQDIKFIFDYFNSYWEHSNCDKHCLVTSLNDSMTDTALWLMENNVLTVKSYGSRLYFYSTDFAKHIIEHYVSLKTLDNVSLLKNKKILAENELSASIFKEPNGNELLFVFSDANSVSSYKMYSVPFYKYNPEPKNTFNKKEMDKKYSGLVQSVNSQAFPIGIKHGAVSKGSFVVYIADTGDGRYSGFLIPITMIKHLCLSFDCSFEALLFLYDMNDFLTEGKNSIDVCISRKNCSNFVLGFSSFYKLDTNEAQSIFEAMYLLEYF